MEPWQVVLVVGLLALLVAEGTAQWIAVRHMRRTDRRAWNVADVDIDFWLYGPAGPMTIAPRSYLWYLLVTRRRLDAATARIAEVDAELRRKDRDSC